MRVRTEAKRDAILQVAASVFIETGFERASMAEIAAQVGGSKATLYGYFASKEELFLAVSQMAGKQQIDPAFKELEDSRGHDDVATGLCRFGEKFMAFLVTPQAIAARRMVIAEAARSEIGRCFHDCGPAKVFGMLGSYLGHAMDAGQLRRADAETATQHLLALLESELIPRRLFGLEAAAPTHRQLRQAVDRAVGAFLAAYAGPAAAPVTPPIPAVRPAV